MNIEEFKNRQIDSLTKHETFDKYNVGTVLCTTEYIKALIDSAYQQGKEDREKGIIGVIKNAQNEYKQKIMSNSTKNKSLWRGGLMACEEIVAEISTPVQEEKQQIQGEK
jgi:hypothetical protein